jgi:hypothetical protein
MTNVPFSGPGKKRICHKQTAGFVQYLEEEILDTP